MRNHNLAGHPLHDGDPFGLRHARYQPVHQPLFASLLLVVACQKGRYDRGCVRIAVNIASKNEEQQAAFMSGIDAGADTEQCGICKLEDGKVTQAVQVASGASHLVASFWQMHR